MSLAEETPQGTTQEQTQTTSHAPSPPSTASTRASHGAHVQMHDALRGMSFDAAESMLRPHSEGAHPKAPVHPVQMEGGKPPGAPTMTSSPGKTADVGSDKKSEPLSKTAELGGDKKAEPVKSAADAKKTEPAKGEADEKTEAEKKVAPPDAKTTTSTVMKKDAAQALLQSVFGTYRTMSAGDVRLLSHGDFRVAWDAVYGGTQYAWATYVIPRFGGVLNGFAHGGVNYINIDAADVTTTPHEMLHNNTAADWTGVVGSPFNEGATEYLEQYALRVGKIPNAVMTHYPNERGVVEAWLASGRTEGDLFTAYLKGGAATIVKKHVDEKCKKAWADVKKSTEESKWAEAKAGLAKK